MNKYQRVILKIPATLYVSPLTAWFWGAYLVATMTPGISAVQFQRQLGLNGYETAFQILHKLRAGMVRQGRDRIGGNLARGDHVEIDETYIGGVTRGEGKGPHADDKSLVVAAVEVRTRPAKKGDKPIRQYPRPRVVGCRVGVARMIITFSPSQRSPAND